ncbi:sugar ABC transporter substrate-binding protein [Sulfitobacter sp. F26169L]|uniref:ABC transporter substrate-binding protein n=1 Tax=Sulfitobacter sp. F26169L TaxID=2996015 RepID=UPI00226091D6|nr:sugar ABC transporter substrate-binding protein [Sulfitobacter sp. F26169L]MCX7567957.1 sugar ABC transporter substrate-binding protein [Sulfitobacter sp. F26169L]
MQITKTTTGPKAWLTGTAMALTMALTAPAIAQESLGTPEEPIELRFLANESFAATWQKTLVPEFNKIYPNINVTIDGVPYPEHLAKLMLDATSANPDYDLLLVDDPWAPQMASIGALVDLKSPEITAMTSDEYDWDDLHPAPLAAGQWQGKQYAVPVRANMLMMLYNKSLYESAGVPLPTPELTWEEFFAQAPKLVQDTDGDGETDAWPLHTFFTRDQLTPTIWQTIMNSNGGKLVDDEGKPAFNDEIGVAALDTQRKLLDYAPPGALGHGFSESLQTFRQGAAANMFMWGSVYKTTAGGSDATTLGEDEVGIQVMPAGSFSAGAHRGVWSLGISSKTENLDASWAFLQWMSSKEGEAFNASETGSFPSRLNTLNNPAEAWAEPVYEAIKNAYDVTIKGEMWRMRHPKSDAAQQILADEVARALAGQATSQEALDTAAQRMVRALR